VATLVLLAGCKPAPPRPGPASRPSGSVVVYTSIDEQFAREVLDAFETQSGIRVDAAYDTEAGKTTGFVRRLMREAERPRCDVWWSSEVFGTIELARGGLLESYDSPAAADIPAEWKDPQKRWTALAARARVVAFNTQRLSAKQVPQTWRTFADPRWARRVAIANPQFGTTRGHLAALFAAWGDAEAKKLLQTLRESGAKLADGNSHAVRLVAAGEADLCWTDTDDVWVAQQRGQPVDLVYPLLDEDGPVVWLPCSVALIRGGPNAAAARALVDFLVSTEVERMLAASDSRNVPVRSSLREQLRMPGPAPQAMDFEKVADALEPAMEAARTTLLR
jgi:iron(III) transport system substrate-binding protein